MTPHRVDSPAGLDVVSGVQAHDVVIPCFSVHDVPRATAHDQRLRFAISYHDGDYAFAHRDELTIHLALTVDPELPSAGGLYLHVDDADALAEEWRAAGVGVIGPDDFDYGKREGSHIDPDGNLLQFGSPLRR